jgi:hypothetical protein
MSGMTELGGWEFDALRAAMQALAAPAELQLARFPDFVVKADELALDFDDALLCVRQNRAADVRPEQTAVLSTLDGFITRMSGPAQPELWTEDAVRSRPEWAALRSLAAAALQAFGWPADPPPPNTAVYVPGAS